MYFHGVFMIILRVENNGIFVIARNVTDNSPAVSFGRRALPRDFNNKNLQKTMIFRALPDIAQLRPSNGVCTQSLVFKRVFMFFFKIILRVENNEICVIARNVTDNSPAISFGK